jgi:hypothetical protein
MMQAVATGRLRSIAEGRQSLASSADLTTYGPHPIAGLDDAYQRFRSLEAIGMA